VQRDPLTRQHEHVDLLLVRRGEQTTVEVPIVIVGEPGIDSIPNHQLNTVSIEADATNLPESIEVDITGRTAGQNITAGDLVLPSGSSLITDAEALVIGFLGAPTAEALEAELSEAEAEAGIEREESAPAAEGAGEGDVVSEPQDQGSGESMDSAEKG
jgi:large subunit ribosomal protein L25